MPILIRHLIEDDAELFISCPQCGRLVLMRGKQLLSGLGVDRRLRNVLHALRCGRCGMLGDITIKFKRVDLAHARLERGLGFHDDWPAGPRDLDVVTYATRGFEETMCNLYSQTTAAEAMRRLFKIAAEHDHLGNAEPLPAIWPKYPAPVVRLTSKGEREMVRMQWGFLTQKLSKRTGKPIAPAAWNNARADKVLKSNLWRESFNERRCLVPASSFREATGSRPATDYWFALQGEEPRPPFAFAGMWRHDQVELRDAAGNTDTHTIITTSANDIVRPIHPDRMPVILRPDDYETYLHGTTTEAQRLLSPYPADQMQIVLQGVGELKDGG